MGKVYLKRFGEVRYGMCIDIYGNECYFIDRKGCLHYCTKEYIFRQVTPSEEVRKKHEKPLTK